MLLQTVFVLTFARVALSVHDFEIHARENYDHVREKCIADTSVDVDLITKANDGIFVDDHNLKCYMRCLFDAFDMFKDDGFLDLGEMVKTIPEEHKNDYEPMLKACIGIGGLGDVCQIAFDLHKCYYKEDPELHFLL